MNCAILYSSMIAGANTQTVFVGQGKDRSPVFIRVQRANNCTPEQALNLAKPRDGETVLNTIEISPVT